MRKGVNNLLTGSGLFDFILGFHLLDIISSTGSNELIRHYIQIEEPLAGFTIYGECAELNRSGE